MIYASAACRIVCGVVAADAVHFANHPETTRRKALNHLVYAVFYAAVALNLFSYAVPIGAAFFLIHSVGIATQRTYFPEYGLPSRVAEALYALIESVA